MKDLILSKLQKVRAGKNGQYTACCPAHEDKSPSLRILFNPDGRILIHCYSGCEANDVLGAIGLSLSDLYPGGAIRDFMASASPKTKPNKYQDWLEIASTQREKGIKLSPETLKLERQMYLRSRNK